MNVTDIGPIIIRVAAWPIETINKLHSAPLTDLVDQWVTKEEAILNDSVNLLNALYVTIPTIKDRSLRSKLLSLGRLIYHSAMPVPNHMTDPIISSNMICMDLKKAIMFHKNACNVLAMDLQKLEHSYKTSLISELNELHKIASDASFQKALYLASPKSGEALQKVKENCNNTKLSRIDYTIYSYLARSVGRGTPSGIWAGVAIESELDNHRDPVSVDWHPPGKVVFTPNLDYFLEALQLMVHQSPLKNKIPLRLNPTLLRKNHFVWKFSNYIDGLWQYLTVQDLPLFPFLVSLFSHTLSMMPKEIENHLLQNITKSEREAKEIVDAIRDKGILWPAIGMPGLYNDPWHALELTIDNLPSEEKVHWMKCIQNLKRICDKLSQSYWEISLEELHNFMDSARTHFNALINRYGDARISEKGNHILLVDLGVPIDFSVSHTLRTKIRDALKRYWNFDRYGLGEMDAVIRRKQEFGSLEIESNHTFMDFIKNKLSLESMHEAYMPDQFTDARLSAWETSVKNIGRSYGVNVEKALSLWYGELSEVYPKHCHRIKADPINDAVTPLCPGSAIVLLNFIEHKSIIKISSLTPDPCMFYSRFNLLFKESNGLDSFARWYIKSLNLIERLYPGLRFAQLSLPIKTNPNAACRPSMANCIIETLNPDDCLLPHLCIHKDLNSKPKIYVRESYLTVVPYLHSANSPNLLDPFSRYFYMISYLLGRPSLIQPLPLLEKEIRDWHHLPRLYIDDTTIISPERWTPPKSVTEELARRSGLDRYIVWRRYVRNAMLPKIIYAKYGSAQTEMLISSDSIIAVEHMGNTLHKHGGIFLLYEVFPPPNESWLCDIEGRHYVAELAISWQGEHLFWDNYLELSIK